MKALLITIGIIVAIVIISVIAAISIRNGLIERDEGVKAAWSQIDTQLQRRADLIPNLVNTVKGYAAHEEKIFTEIADAAARLPGGPKGRLRKPKPEPWSNRRSAGCWPSPRIIRP